MISNKAGRLLDCGGSAYARKCKEASEAAKGRLFKM